MENYSFYILIIALISGAYYLGKKQAWFEANKKLDEVYKQIDKLKNNQGTVIKKF